MRSGAAPAIRLVASRLSRFLRLECAWLEMLTPVRTRRLYFSEKLLDPGNPNSATEFYLTVDGQTPAPFDPKSGVPNIIAQQGTVEDWIIENRSNELHACSTFIRCTSC